MSECRGHNRKREVLSSLMKKLKEKEGTSAGKIIPPKGFVLNESRVGSTLVANTLTSDPFSMVFSESPPPANVLLHMGNTQTDRSLQVRVFRDVITLMGNNLT